MTAVDSANSQWRKTFSRRTLKIRNGRNTARWPRTASRHTEIPAQLSQIVRGDIHESRGIDKIAAGLAHGFFHDSLLELEDSGFKASNARLPGFPREHRFGQIFRLDEFVLAKDERLFGWRFAGDARCRASRIASSAAELLRKIPARGGRGAGSNAG